MHDKHRNDFLWPRSFSSKQKTIVCTILVTFIMHFIKKCLIKAYFTAYGEQLKCKFTSDNL